MKKFAFIGLGSNIAGSESTPIDQLIAALTKINSSRDITITSVSSLYKSKPIGLTNQPDFINAVIKVKTNFCPEELLEVLQGFEKMQGRERIIHWGPRTIDLDILIYENLEVSTQNLKIPHPRMFERAFVMLPLIEIEPSLSEMYGYKSSDILENLANQSIVKLMDNNWENWRVGANLSEKI